MVNIYDKDGCIILDAPDYQLKIDKNRNILVRNNKDKKFSSIDVMTPLGMSTDDKKRYLYELHRKIEAKLTQSE